jgi:phenylacetate-CoA ligase
VLKTAFACRQIAQSRGLDAESVRRLQDAKVRRLIRHAYDTVPYYHDLLRQAGLVPEDINGAHDLQFIPMTSRETLQDQDAAYITSTKTIPEKCVRQRTSGSSGRPLTLLIDRHFQIIRNALFLRALMAAAYRPGDKLLLITDTRGAEYKTWYRWHYVSIEESAAHLLESLNSIRPAIVYGCVTPLRQIADLARERGLRVHHPRSLICTAEHLSKQIRDELTERFTADVYDIYGLTEMGMIAWECEMHSGYHVAEETIVMEHVPVGEAGIDQLVMTNLELFSVPLIRYETGDLAGPRLSGQCACGRHGLRLSRIEGRNIDAVRMADGNLLSPYRVTLRLERVPGIRRYQVIQEGVGRFVLRYQGNPACEIEVRRHAQNIFRALFGADTQVIVVREESLEPHPGRKFRIVENRLR